MKNWKVLFVKPRTEKKITEYCTLYGIPYYLPLREKTRKVNRREFKVSLPVFPGYVFVNLPASHKLDLQKTNLLVRILAPFKPRAMLRELIMVRRALRINPSLTPVKPIIKGKRVRIIAGPFMGIEGLVVRLTSKMKVVLNIEMIGQAIAAEVAKDEIEIIE